MAISSGIKVLTIDDDDFVRELIAAFLEDCGFNVLQAANGREGLKIIREQYPDLALLDLRMPEMDGLEVLSIVTQEYPDFPVVVVSGMGTIGDAIKALKFGAWDYITKPIQDMAVLEHSVNKVLERANLLRENRRYREHLEEEVKKRTAELEQRSHDLENASKILRVEVEERRRAEQEVSKVNLDLTTLSSCVHAVVRGKEEYELIKEVCRIIVEVGQYRMAWVGFVEHGEAKRILPVVHMGYDDGYLDNSEFTWADNERGCDPTGTAARAGKVVINNNTLTNPAVTLWREEALNRGYGSSVAIPLIAQEQTLGVLNIYAEEIGAFDENKVKRLVELADDLAYGINAIRLRFERKRMDEELEKSVQDLRKALEGTVQVIASTVEVRDPYTAGHQRRVAVLAKSIAMELGMTPEKVDAVFMAGVVHDLGKISVPAEILSKPSELNPIEFNLIKTHPQVGYELLKTIEFPWPIAEIVYQHHEKLNGSGYPNGLTGDEIMFEARVLTVADVVEAMGSHRPYRPTRGLDNALAEITRNKGRFYDPTVVDACLRLFTEKKYEFEPLPGRVDKAIF